MFKITRRTDYAVRVMLCLARRPAGTRLPTQIVQSEMQIPRPFLQRIIADLSRVNLLNTFAGPSGGIELAQSSKDIHLRLIWEAIEGPILISDCLSGDNSCPLESGCPVQRRWNRLQNIILRELESISLDELAAEVGSLPAEISIQAMTGNLFIPINSE